MLINKISKFHVEWNDFYKEFASQLKIVRLFVASPQQPECH